ncbi:MAG: transposase, partial [Alphaproteobacteria bacterium]|nr:transposase [Alphaproteobacteria bacterium]
MAHRHHARPSSKKTVCGGCGKIYRSFYDRRRHRARDLDCGGREVWLDFEMRLAVMDMWKPFRKSTQAHAPNASILFDKFHILRHLGDALDQVRKMEYARITVSQRKFIKGQKYVLLSHRKNLTSEGMQSLKLLLKAN